MTFCVHAQIKISNTTMLRQIVLKHIREEGPFCNLNHLDVSDVTEFSHLFNYTNANGELYGSFCGDISQWDTSQAITMRGMFYMSKFNGDISKWDTSNVRDMTNMFAYSPFRQNISQWNTSRVRHFDGLFDHCPFNGDLRKWRVPLQLMADSIFDKEVSLGNMPFSPFVALHALLYPHSVERNLEWYSFFHHTMPLIKSLNLTIAEQANALYDAYAALNNTNH